MRAPIRPGANGRSCLTMPLVLCIAASAIATPLLADERDRRLDIWWTDVERGAATLIVTPAGESILIDTGMPGARDPYRIARTVKERARLDRIDHLVVTHFDIDHYGGTADLAQRVAIGRVWDPGLPDPKGNERLKRGLAAYRMATGGRRTVLKPGDRIPLRQREVGKTAPIELVCLGAAQKFVEGTDDKPRNPLCAEHEPKAPDRSQNAESIVLLLRVGAFDFLDAADLTWNLEKDLVCPVNVVGKVDVYQVDHHGLDRSNNPVLVRSIEPRVAVMNNGYRKGCMAEVVETLRGTPSIEAVYQLHRNLRKPELNTTPELVANRAKDCTAEVVKLSVAPDGKSYTVEIPSAGHRRTFQTK